MREELLNPEPVPEDLAEKNWMYFPEPDSPFYRVTVFSNYSPANVPDPARTWAPTRRWTLRWTHILRVPSESISAKCRSK